MATTGTITSFSTTPNTIFDIGGDPYYVETAGKSYSLTNPDSQTLRFEIRPGDKAYYDGGVNVDRSEIDGAAGGTIPVGTPININYQFMVEPNGPNGSFTNTASWFVTAELHNYDPALGSNVHTSPPFAIQLAGDHLQVVARYTQPGGNPVNGSSDLHMLTLWTDPNPIQTGQYNNISIQANVSQTGSGYLKVSVNGTQVVNYQGPLGYGAATYWAEGLYRNAGPSETVAADFRNFTMTTGSAATAPIQPTTPTSPTTPENLAPTVTQASASPGTGIADNGDTITMTLGFSEAVTVTGTPTLSLNDGATATYVGGTGTSSLTFKTTVAPTDKDTSALAITGVNLPSGASIKDASGLAANLSGAVKTFSGLQIDTTTSTTPTDPTTPTTPTTPSSVTKPVLTIADDSLWVAGRGGTVDLGTKVTTTDANDVVTVNITGLPRYETITDKLDGQTFRGNNITLTAAQVDSGLELHSYYRGGAHPVATLTLTANAKDPVTGAVTSAAPQTITVTDPRPAATTTPTSPPTTTVTTPPSSTSASSGFPGGLGSPQRPHADPATSAAASTTPQLIAVADRTLATAAGAGFLANQGFAMLQQRMETVTSTLATSRPQAIVTDPQLATGTATASLASRSFALLNQYLAGNTGRVDPGQIVAAMSRTAGFGQEAILTRPQH